MLLQRSIANFDPRSTVAAAQKKKEGEGTLAWSLLVHGHVAPHTNEIDDFEGHYSACLSETTASIVYTAPGSGECWRLVQYSNTVLSL